jgi:hypothetical protein
MKWLGYLALACLATASGSAYQLLGGRLQFTVPADWREVSRRVEGDSLGFVAFVVPRPASHASAPAGNVMIDAALSHDRWDLRTYSDGKLAQEAAGPGQPTVVDDEFWKQDNSRTVLSTSRLRGVPYALWDKFAVRDSVLIDIRTAIPVAYATDSLWQARYDAALDSLLRSLRIGREPVFRTAH